MLVITDWRQINIGRDDRITLIGATGCGKTTAARFFIEDKNKICSVVYDNKPSETIYKWQDTQKLYQDYRSLKTAQENRLIYRPPVTETLSADLQDRFFQWIYEENNNTRLYIDEAGALRGGVNPSFFLQACICRGRELGISTITGTQRPARIPTILMSEAEHFLVFRLNMHADRVRVADMTTITPEMQMTLRQYEFYYYNSIMGEHSNKLKLDIPRVTPQHVLFNNVNRSKTNARATATTTF